MRFFGEEEQEEQGNSNNGVLSVAKIVLSILFAPIVIVSVSIFLIFMRMLRWKPLVSAVPLGLLFILLYLLSSTVLSGMSEITFSSLAEGWATLLLSYLYVSLLVGIVTGFVYILFKAWDLKRYPEYKYISGWAYGFEYVPTPLETMRKKRNIKSLKSGSLFDYEKAPIGVIDAPVKADDLERTLDMKNSNKASVVYRHYSEAMAHTLITGKTGSGKALHVDTPIRTKEAGLTTVGKVEVGDTLYNEFGNHTELLAIYKPMTPDHYEIYFEEGVTIKCCGDHLWNIGDVEQEKTFSTRELFKNFTVNIPYRISHSIDGERIHHKVILMKKIEDNPEDYVCFTVDSPSRLFLVTEANIPTHNTVTMLSLVQNDILAGHPVCLIDFKKSPDLIYFLSKWARENDREFYHFVSGKPGTYKNPNKDNQATYDPLSTGGATSKADMILNLRSWDSASEVFKKRTQDVLQSLFFLLERTPRELVPGIEWNSGGLAQFVSALDLNNFRKMIEVMSKDMTSKKLSDGDIRRYNTLVDLYKELSSKTKSDLKAQITELLSIARTLIVSNYGDWLATGASDYHIDLMEVATSQDAPVVLFSFNQQEEPEFAKYIGSIVMSDLSRVSALKNAKGDTTKFGVYIDEFQTLDPRTVKDNLEKARSSKMYITLSLQSIDQIVSSVETGDGTAMANAIIDTCSNFIFHDGSGYDTAEKMSKIIGKSSMYVYRTASKTRPGMVSRLLTVDSATVSKDIQEDWLVPPSEFQSLESPTETNDYKATAYVVNKASDDSRFKRSGGALARKIQVVVAAETARGIPPEFKKAIYVEPSNRNVFVAQSVERLNPIDPLNQDDGDWAIEDIEEDLVEEENFGHDLLATVNIEMPIETQESIGNQESLIKKQEPLVKKESLDRNDSMQTAPVFEELNDISPLNEAVKDNPSQLDIFNQLRAKKPQAKKPQKKESPKDTKEPIIKSSNEQKEDMFKLPDLD